MQTITAPVLFLSRSWRAVLLGVLLLAGSFYSFGQPGKPRKPVAGARNLRQPRAQLSPTPDSLLLLADEKDNLTDASRTVTEQQRTLVRQIQAHQKQAPEPLHKPNPVWEAWANWFELDKEVKAKQAKAQVEFKGAARKLAARKAALTAQETKLRQQLKRNARLTRRYAAWQANQQLGLAGTTEQFFKRQGQKAANRIQQARKRQAKQDSLAYSYLYQQVLPGMLPLTDYAQQLQDFVAHLAVRLWANKVAYIITPNMSAVDGTRAYRNLQAVFFGQNGQIAYAGKEEQPLADACKRRV